MCGAPHSDTSLHVAGRKATLLATAPSAVVCRGPGPAPHAQAGDGRAGSDDVHTAACSPHATPFF